MSRYLPIAARLLLGLPFTVFALNYFVPFLPMPKEIPPDHLAVMGALVTTRYLLVAKVLELAAGLSLLGNRFVPLALTILAPIEIAILLFHVSLDGIKAAGLPLFLMALTIYLAWTYRAAFAPMLRPKVALAGESVKAA